MNERLQFMMKHIGDKKSEQFTGAVKFGVERGAIVSVGEANAYDAVVYTDEIVTQEKIIELLQSSIRISFNGTVVFRFSDGVVNGFAYSRTYKGDELKRLMGLN